MADPIHFSQRATVILDRTLANLEKSRVLAPGARAELHRQALSGNPGTSGAIGKLFAILEGPGGSRYLDPDRPAGASNSVLRRILAAVPISADGRRQLESGLSMEANGLADVEGLVRVQAADAARAGRHFDADAERAAARGEAARRVAEKVMQAMGERDARTYWADRDLMPEIPTNERRTREALEALSHHIDRSVDLDDLAKSWATFAGNGSPRDARQAVATRLKMPMYAQQLARDGVPPEIDFMNDVHAPTEADAAFEAEMRQGVEALQAAQGAAGFSPYSM